MNLKFHMQHDQTAGLQTYKNQPGRESKIAADTYQSAAGAGGLGIIITGREPTSVDLIGHRRNHYAKDTDAKYQ